MFQELTDILVQKYGELYKLDGGKAGTRPKSLFKENRWMVVPDKKLLKIKYGKDCIILSIRDFDRAYIWNPNLLNNEAELKSTADALLALDRFHKYVETIFSQSNPGDDLYGNIVRITSRLGNSTHDTKLANSLMINEGSRYFSAIENYLSETLTKFYGEPISNNEMEKFFEEFDGLKGFTNRKIWRLGNRFVGLGTVVEMYYIEYEYYADSDEYEDGFRMDKQIALFAPNQSGFNLLANDENNN